MTSPKALRDWCRLTCAGYPSVEIRNMSTSFRDGLAFCAIIHRHRPDLLDFSSLSRENVYQNNKLAFEVAETKLGIPALLDPNDLLSSRAPDCLSIITYLYQYYYFFNRKSYAGPVTLKTSHVGVLHSLTKTKTPAGLKPRKSLTDLKTCREDRFSSSRPRTVCSLCFKPVHLIQRYLIDGKVYHRSCFRCRVCHSTLLSGSYTRGSEAGFFFCSHHTGDSLENWPRSKSEEGYSSLGGSVISSVPHYTEHTETQDGPVPEAQERHRETKVKKPPRPRRPPAEPDPADRTTPQEVTRTEELSESSLPGPPASDRIRRPVPAPRRTMNPSAGNTTRQNKSPPAPSHMSRSRSSPSSSQGSPKVRTNHPWLNIVHPGPWTQLPPAPPPVPAPRTKFSARYRPRAVPPNPFEEDMVEDAVDQGPTKIDALNPFAEDMIQDSLNRGRPKVVPTNPFAEDIIEDPLDPDLSRSVSLNPFVEDMKEDVGRTDPLNPFTENMKETREPDRVDQTKPPVAAKGSGRAGPEPGYNKNTKTAPPLTDGARPQEVTAPAAGGVIAVPAAEGVLAVPAAGGVIAVPAAEGVLAVPAAEGVLAVPAAEGVLAVPAAEGVMAVPAAEGVMVVPVAEGVLAVSAAEGVMAVPAAEGVMAVPAAEGVMAVPPAEGVLAVPAAEGVLAVPAAEGVLAVPAAEGVLAIPAAEGVLAVPAAEGVLAVPAAEGVLAIPAAEGVLAVPAAEGMLAVPAAEGVVAGTAVLLTLGTLSQSVDDLSQREVMVLGEAGNMRGSLQNVSEAAALTAAAQHEDQGHNLPRSLSVPAMTSSRCQSSSPCVDLMEDQVSWSESQLACKVNPFHRKPMTKSKTCQSLASSRGPAPGHGFPLIRRKVQTDQNVSTEDLRSEMREVDQHLQGVEQRGVQLERDLRDCKNDQQEEQMLVEWFSLVREKNSLVRRDTELIHLAKQQRLEERQADVEYQLRCLLNKPEGDWTKEDCGHEQQLMDELVTIIEERDEIISSLDQDRLREQDEDMSLDTMKTDKELQKEELKDLKKGKGKFRPKKVFKLLNH